MQSASASGYGAGMARTKLPPVTAHDKDVIGGSLRELRRGAGFRSVEAAANAPSCPASRQTIYAYERGGLVPSLAQFLQLVEFYVLDAPHGKGAKPEDDLRAHGVAAITLALTLDAYHVPRAMQLIARLGPDGRADA